MDSNAICFCSKVLKARKVFRWMETTIALIMWFFCCSCLSSVHQEDKKHIFIKAISWLLGRHWVRLSLYISWWRAWSLQSIKPLFSLRSPTDILEWVRCYSKAQDWPLTFNQEYFKRKNFTIPIAGFTILLVWMLPASSFYLSWRWNNGRDRL